MWIETLEADFERLLGPPAAGRLARPERLVIALRRLDRYAGMGEGKHGVGLQLAQQLLEAQAEDVADAVAAWEREQGAEWLQMQRRSVPRRPTPPRHLGYFVPELLRVGRKWRRTHRPHRRRERMQQAARTIKQARAPRA